MRQTGKLFNLLLIAIGFVGALFIYNPLFNAGLGIKGLLAGTVSSIVAFWIASELQNDYAGGSNNSWWILFIEQFCLGTGVNLVLHSVLTYTLYIRRTPLFIVLGGLLASALLTLHARYTAKRGQARRRFLFVGYDSVMAKILQALGEPVIGIVCSEQEACPPHVPWLGEYSDLPAILKTVRPTNIVVDIRTWSRDVPAHILLDCRLAGIEIHGSSALYESLYQRVCAERLRPADILLSTALRGDSRIIAVQSVYTDLIAIALLLTLMPLLLLIALVIKLFSGPGPVLEGFECAGFQYIPFRLLRFRTTRSDGSVRTTFVGGLIRRLRLVNLPQLLNVIRGDMALVGPRPVRSEFAHYLSELMPFHSHRFSVKPGITGLALMHARGANSIPEELRMIEHDLYYVKEGSLWMDIPIILQSIGPGSSSETPATAVSVPQGAGY